MKKKSAVYKFSVYHYVFFTYFESLTVYHRAGCVPEKAYNCMFECSEPLFLLRLNGCAVPSLHRESIDSLICKN